MKRFLYVLYFLALVPEEANSWGGSFSPLQFLSAFLAWNPLKLPMLDIAIIAILILGKNRNPKCRTRGMVKAIWVSITALIVWILWGITQGSNTYQVQFQLHSLALSFILAFAMAKVLATPEDFFGMGKVIAYATVYRSLTCIAFYYSKALAHEPPPESCTGHGDSVLYVAGLMSIIVYALHQWRSISGGTRFKLIFGIVLILLAIQFNNRRMAWVSLIGSLIVFYFLIPTGRIKKRVNRFLVRVGPVLAVYVFVGMGRPEAIFKPVQSLSTVKSKDDPSTKSRDNENMGLLVTLGIHPFMGWGWGQQYIEVDSSLSAGNVGFVQYRYLPHNSVLGLLAFTGVLGFAATWIFFPMSAFFNAYAAKHSAQPLVRMAAIIGASEVIVVVNQWYGDIGLCFLTPGLVMAGSIAGAIRLPALCQKEQLTNTNRTRDDSKSPSSPIGSV
jgi:hypothetical protein